MIAAALAAAAAAMAPAAAPASPQAFVAGLYLRYRRDPDFSPLRRPRLVFAPRLAAAISEDERLSTGEVGFLDGDPLCDCQDAADLRATVARVERKGPGTRVEMLIRLAGNDRRRLRLTLVRVGSVWRIADIASAREPSLLADLERENRRRSRR
jgi:hypothetical protein